MKHLINDITYETLLNDIRVIIKEELSKDQSPKTVRGIKGIQEIFKCKYAKAWQIKKSGIIDKAIIQRGRHILIDVEKAMKLYSK